MNPPRLHPKIAGIHGVSHAIHMLHGLSTCGVSWFHNLSWTSKPETLDLTPIFWGGSGLDCSLNSNISLESCGFWNWKTHLAPSFLCNSVGAEKTAIREDLKASSRCTSACRQVPLRVAAGVKLDGKSCHKQYLWYFCGILWYFVVIWYMSNISYL